MATLTFLDSHTPDLPPGDYTIRVEQHVEGTTADKEKFADDFLAERYFSVMGPRFTLAPQEIQEVFPPPGSLGEYDNVLPHVILNRSTLPWERSAADADHRPDHSPVPWLALLLFEEQEMLLLEDEKKQASRSVKLGDLKNKSAYFKTLSLEKGDHPDDQVSVIDVPRKLLEQLIPTKNDLEYLAHVRRNNGKQEEVAVLIGNRLPARGMSNIVHLVSLERRYRDGKFQFQGDDSVLLVSLKSWRFSCISAKQTFKGLLTHLNHQLLWNLPVTPDIRTALNSSVIPEQVAAAFKQFARPLGDGAKIREYSQWRIDDQGVLCYLISNKWNVFNRAGKQLWHLNAEPDGEGLLKDQPGLVAEFSGNSHAPGPKATIRKQPADHADHWWIEDRNHNVLIDNFLISQDKQGGNQETLFAYDLGQGDTNTLRLPALDGAENEIHSIAETYFRRGCVPLPHALRSGQQAISWYHGPLTPGENTTAAEFDLPLPVRSADELLHLNTEHGMLDVSYAAAWELGRLLTLQNTKVAVDLFNWKRAHAHDEQLLAAEHRLLHLPCEKSNTDISLPPTVVEWFDNLAKLIGVPFTYLVPDERMLPLESIRFFRVDWQWIECLLDGAFSIGRVMPVDHRRDRTHTTTGHARDLVSTRQRGVVTGMLLRSDVVSGWPGMLVDGHADNEDETKLPGEPLRMARLSKNVLLCLFAGEVRALGIHQKPETPHFGFSRPVDDRGYHREKRNGDSHAITWLDQGKRVVDVHKLSKDLESVHSAQFAIDMIEGAERVVFQVE